MKYGIKFYNIWKLELDNQSVRKHLTDLIEAHILIIQFHKRLSGNNDPNI